MKYSENYFEFTLKTHVKSGIGAINKIPDYLYSKKYNNIGFVVDYNLYKALPALELIINKCNKKFESIVLHFYKEKFEPTYQYLDQVKWDFKKNNNPLVDCIIGIGGGSTIDLAKGIATLITNHEPSIFYRGFPKNLNPSIPIIAVPSTAGTGTELAYNAVFIDEESKTKLGINSKNNYPILSILDPEIVCNAPQTTVIGSGIGALIRTIETLVTPKANSVSKLFSIQGFKLILDSLPEVIKNKENLEYWSRMQWGAYYSMAALSNSTSGPAGAIAYFLSTNFNVPQGMGYGIAGLKYAQLNQSQGYYGYSELFDTLSNRPDNILNDKDKSEYVINRIKDLFSIFEVPVNLESLGIKLKDYSLLYEFCTKTAKGSLEANPIQFKNEIIGKMLKKMIEG